VTDGERPHESPRGPILLLAGQGFALGLAMAWILIPASAIFLAAYGSELLPVTYLGAAVAGIVSSTLLAAAFRRRPLASVATATLAGLSVLLLVSWIVLATFGAEWVSFVLLVLVPIMVPVGFIFVVGQAGMLLDVRVLKKFYARVVAGFALGFVTGGLAGPLLLTVLGTTESVLAAAAAATALLLVLIEATRRRYPAKLAVIEHEESEAERPTLRGLVRNRYVMLIVAFQMLSAVESQWLDYHVLSSAAQRYESSDALARFLSQFSAIAYGTDIAFLLVLAGLLLHRFGLRYGLTANAIAVLTVVAAIIVTTSFLGSGATIVFVLIVAARVTDLTFSDGTSRTSLSAAYQAVPTRMRSVVQATVEGLAVPLAIGASGAVLLVVQALGGTEGLMLPVLTATVVTAWVVVAVLLYREYRSNLLANLRGRTLDPTDLAVEEESGLIAIDRLIRSDDERDVRLGLDILTTTEHPELSVTLQSLATDERVNVRTDALERLLAIDPDAAAAAARHALDDPSPRVRAAAIRALGAAGSRSDVAAIAARGTDSTPDVAVAVAAALSRLGDDTVRAEVSADIARLGGSSVHRDRTVAALMLGVVEPGDWVDRTTLHDLLADLDPAVVNAALSALRSPDDAALVPEIASRLEDRRTSAAALDALVRVGDAALVVIDDGLRDGVHSRRVLEMLVRAAREIGGSSAIAVLQRHVRHHDREVGLAAMRALAASGGSNSTTPADPTESVVADDLEHATHALRALVTFESVPAAALQCAALRDELELIRQRVLAAFSMRHATEGFDRVAFQLAQRDSRSHALALEWLDVTLTGTDRAAVALLEPGVSDRERLNTLTRTFPLAALGQREVLLELIQDTDGRWRRPWVKACALYTASGISNAELEAVIAATVTTSSDGGHDDEHIVHETLAGLKLSADQVHEVGS
jgi:HEAT repeat protein